MDDVEKALLKIRAAADLLKGACVGYDLGMAIDALEGIIDYIEEHPNE